MLTHFTCAEFQSMAEVRFYLVSDHSAGFAIDSDGELFCLFNESGIRGLGRILLTEAVNLGAKHLFCFDGYLFKLYSQFGFVEYEREKWNPDLAPADWPDDTRPDVVYMKRANS